MSRLNPTIQRQYQTAGEALELIRDANNSGQSVKVDKNGDLVKVEQLTGGSLAKATGSLSLLEKIFLFFTKKSNSNEATQSAEVIWTVLNKMKIEISQVSEALYGPENNSKKPPRAGLKHIMQNQMADLKHFQKTGKIGGLMNQWIELKEKLPVDLTAKIELALPRNFHVSENFDDIIKATITIPQDEQKKLYSTLIEPTSSIEPKHQPTQSNKVNEDGLTGDGKLVTSDPNTNLEATDDTELLNKKLSQINKQTRLDFGRATFIFEDTKGSISTHTLGADPKNIMRDMLGLVNESGPESLTILKTISDLPNQTTVATLLIPTLYNNLTRDNTTMKYSSNSDTEKDKTLRQVIYKMKRCSDGGLEFDLVVREKIHFMILSDGSMVSVNNQSSWKGNVDEKNFGFEMSTKIKVSKADLTAGTLNDVSIIKPLEMKYQFQFNKPEI